MSGPRVSRPVLRVGDWVQYDDGEHQVVALAGTSVRLKAAAGSELVVLLPHLLGSPGFGVIDGESLPEIEPYGLFDGLPEDVVATAKDWERHIVEVMTGLPPDPEPGAVPRPEYDPATTTIKERAGAKATELGVGVRTIFARRARYAAQGLWGLVDQRAVREWQATGRVDARVVRAVQNALEAETNASTGTRSRLIRKVTKALESDHGPGAVPLPGKTTFYRLIEVLSTGRHTFGSASTRRQLANRPEGAFTPTLADRPGEQVQIDSTPLDVLVVLDSGVAVRADLTIAVDVATRTICAAVLRPEGTKAVDASLLLAKMLVPEPMRPGWCESLRMSASLMPHGRLMDIDARMEAAAAKPVIVPDGVVIDGGKVFISDAFTRACDRLGISVQRARPNTPTDKAVVEATFPSINSLFTQYLAAHTGSNTDRRGRRVEEQAVWTVPELQDLLDEWLIAGWQHRPHDALRDPFFPRRMMTPNEKYSALVAACGYLPLVLNSEDYLELLPVKYRAINAYGIRIDYRAYDCRELWPHRRQHSGNTRKKGLWEIHYDPYDLSQVFVRTTGGWITVPWTHRAMVTGPFADFTWNLARRESTARGLNDQNEAEVARVLDELLTRAGQGPARDSAKRRTERIVARTKVAAATHQPPSRQPADNVNEPGAADEADDIGESSATVVPFGISDAHAEAEKWI
ncbi:Mu transposase C-terminal domain-containing protein [Actinomadura sp. BRA 177]|uniref:Mu transposase C-terminal domain-containing protein n=1 Tax=Actinomadura sp. BRA 177 TaxID=2745202 RepID=UPI001595B410|nr:Mu transposase C-terminal domain-containing protein [Actinomadura sp. BRA 177]NVI89855.1 DDE-type integrase/transposase/recombinase [Actinomadura sp. BRA 177]